MIKTFLVAFSAIVLSFVVTVAVAQAQSPSPEASPTVIPSEAPATGQAAQ